MSGAVSDKTHGAGEYYAALDGFRGLLAVFVAVYHTIWLSHPNSWSFFNNGPVIIDLFFALSGFLMWRLYADRMNNAAEVKLFLKRRFARLYPLHAFMLIVFVGFSVLRLFVHKIGLAEVSPGEILPFEPGAQEGWFALLQHLTLTHTMGLSDSLSFNPPSWTIGAEFWTYIVFVFVMLWCKPKRLFHFLIIGSGVGLIYLGLSRLKPDMNITHDYGFWRCLAGFFTGVLAAASFRRMRGIFQDLSKVTLTLVEVAVIVLSVGFVIYAGGAAQFWIGPVIFVFILFFALDGGAVSRFMSRSLFRYLAKISYSVYLTHVIIAIAFEIVIKRLTGGLPSGWEGDAWLVLYLCVVIGVSHLTYKLVEIPGGRFIRNWHAPQKRVAKSGSSV
jgi:peptidoglycan/LPS O-acetylase OafA/YrhL